MCALLLAVGLVVVQQGLMLNNTLLAESTITTLQSQVAGLQLAAGQLSDLVAEYTTLAPVQLSGPPECGPPSGNYLQYMNGSWVCVCAANWPWARNSDGTCGGPAHQLFGVASQFLTYYNSNNGYGSQNASNANDNSTLCEYGPPDRRWHFDQWQLESAPKRLVAT